MAGFWLEKGKEQRGRAWVLLPRQPREREDGGRDQWRERWRESELGDEGAGTDGRYALGETDRRMGAMVECRETCNEGSIGQVDGEREGRVVARQCWL